ncbi:MAG: arylsulfatase [Planctomycetaceae bacterium]|nr:arylsulfatase [Planctomycetaceae bacterium]
MPQLTRRQFVGTAASAAALMMLPDALAGQPALRWPNIVFILADDLGYGDLGCYGQTKFQTPNIDRLAAEGMRFTQHYAGSTVCAPSRCSLMTGLHTGHCQIRGNKGVEPEGQWPLKQGTVTIALMLKQAGCVTGAFGKWGLGSPGSTGDPNRQGFDHFFGYNCQTLAHKYYQRHLWRNQEKVLLPQNDPEKQKGQYCHDLIMNEALRFIRAHKNRPFFAFLPVTIPHAELSVPEDSLSKYKDKFLEQKRFQPNNEKGYGSQYWPRAAFAAMVDRLDGNVGQLLALLKELQIDDNTVVLFSSDNGPHREGGSDPDFFHSSGPLRGYKRDVYEGGIRVPLLVRWPSRITAGITSGHVCAFWDMLPTLAGLAGLKQIPQMDGLSFVPTLLNKPTEQTQHEHLYWEFHEQGGKQAVRMGSWKGVRLNAMKNSDGPIELYDLIRDVGEQTNIAERHPEIVDRMACIMKQEHQTSETFPFFVRDEQQSM